jgi:transcriptional regulator GlxA family with amidase domain
MDERIDAVQRMQDYIECNLAQDISLADLAKAAGYSPWYSYRLFHSLLHMTPSVYIRRLRLSKSALRLRDEKVKIIDVAYDSGSEKHFSVSGSQHTVTGDFRQEMEQAVQKFIRVNNLILESDFYG